MSASVGKAQVLSLYKKLLRESEKFTNYNYRLYALRKIQYSFRAHKSLADSKVIKNEFELGKENLEMIKRQVTIGNMYKTEKLVIENKI